MKINFMWIGDHLNKMCQLTLKSFLDNGHEPVLWLYNKRCLNVPDGIKIENAGEIIDPSLVFSYSGNGDCRKNSYGGFSDIFRYHLIDKIGGWYCDMDVTCLKNFEPLSNKDYVFRSHIKTEVVANIFKCPKNNEFLKSCIYETEKQIDINNHRWIKPLEILQNNIKKFELQNFITKKEIFGDDDIKDLENLLTIGKFQKNIFIPEYAIHWCNEAVNTGTWQSYIKRNWDVPVPTTFYYKLLKKHKLI